MEQRLLSQSVVSRCAAVAVNLAKIQLCACCGAAIAVVFANQ